MQQTHGEFLKLLSLGPLPQGRVDFLLEDHALQRLTLVCMRRPTVLPVPRRPAPVYPLRLVTRPRPRLDHAVQYQLDRERPDAGVHVPYLLLACSPYLLDIVEQWLDGAAVGHRFQDRFHRQRRVGAEVSQPALVLTHHHHADAASCRRPRRLEALDGLDHQRAVLHAPDTPPATLLPGTLGQVDTLLAVGRHRPSRTTPACRRRQRAQVGVLAQAAEHQHTQGHHRLEEGTLGVAAIDDQTQFLAQAAQPNAQPTDPFGGQFQLGAKGPRRTFGQLGNVLGTDVEEGTQRQGQRAPGRVADQPGQRDPEVAINELRAGRSRRGVVVDAGALHLGAVASGGRIVDSEQQRVAGGVTAGGPESVVGVAEVAGDAGSAGPGGDGASAFGEQGADEQQEQARSRASIEGSTEVVEAGGQKGRQLQQWHGRLLGRTKGVDYPSSCSRSRLVSTCSSCPCFVTLLTALCPIVIAYG